MESERADRPVSSGETPTGAPDPGRGGETPARTTGPTEAAGLRRFFGTVSLDPTRISRDASEVGEAVVAHLNGLVGARVQVTLEIHAEIPDGAPQDVVRTVTENTMTLRFDPATGFEPD